MKTKIIQIQDSAFDGQFFQTALCEDGSIWERSISGGKWIEWVNAHPPHEREA